MQKTKYSALALLGHASRHNELFNTSSVLALTATVYDKAIAFTRNLVSRFPIKGATFHLSKLSMPQIVLPTLPSKLSRGIQDQADTFDEQQLEQIIALRSSEDLPVSGDVNNGEADMLVSENEAVYDYKANEITVAEPTIIVECDDIPSHEPSNNAVATGSSKQPKRQSVDGFSYISRQHTTVHVPERTITQVQGNIVQVSRTRPLKTMRSLDGFSLI